MSLDASGESRALAPILAVAGGLLPGTLVGFFWSRGVPPVLLAVLAGLGVLSLAAALVQTNRVVIWVAIGLSLGFASGAGAWRHEALTREAVPEGSVVRANFRVLQGWETRRWGRATQVQIISAHRGPTTLPLFGRARLEVRGLGRARRLPDPGTVVEALASVHWSRTTASLPFLVVSSQALLNEIHDPTGLPALRSGAARDLLIAAGTSVHRIRAAELAGALALGRRDLLPRAVRDQWRQSGLAHVLAVSGLHVGVLAGLIWLVGAAAGVRPQYRRLTVFLVVPTYVLLAGAAPSAIRAGLMIELYLVARLLGRHVLPLGAVALAAVTMVLVRPTVIFEPGFQLTVIITAAILRWAGPVAGLIPAPRSMALALAVPLVAQVAALPLIAWHFRDIAPAAALTNVLAVVALPVLITLSIAAAATAALWPPATALLLSLLGPVADAVLALGGPARAHHLTVPSTPPVLAAGILLVLLAALLPGRIGRQAVGVLPVLLVGIVAWAAIPQPALRPRLSLLPVTGGASVLVRDHGRRVLLDGGRSRVEADRLLTDIHVGRLDMVVATHTDEDHIGGLLRILRRHPTGILAFPRWMLSAPETVPLLRAARRSGAAAVPLLRGFGLTFGDLELRGVWPPLHPHGFSENDRSLVVLALLGGRSALIPADTTSKVEARYTTPPPVAGLLVVPHHGSRSSCSNLLLDRVRPSTALIPAGPGNRYHHPHMETLLRLRRARVPFLVARTSPWCGAEVRPDGGWRLLP